MRPARSPALAADVRRPAWLRIPLAGVVALLAVLVPAPAADAEPVESTRARNYSGAEFGPGVTRSPTQRAQQSKLWFHDGAWWAAMADASSRDVRIFELMADHTWRPTAAVVNDDQGDTGDALADGEVTYVLARNKAQRLQLVQLTYQRVTREYVPAGPPAIVTDRGASESGTIVKDTTGRLWMSFATSQEVLVSFSDDRGRTWRPPFVLAPTGSGVRREAAALVTFDRSVGLLWSEQAGGAFRFAAHRDGAAPTDWTRETALAGPGRSQDNLSVKVIDRDPADVVVAAVQTVGGDEPLPPETPMIIVVVRAPDGTWSEHNAATVDAGLSAPILQVGASDESIYLLAESAGSIYVKRATLSDITFAPARGIPLLLSNNRRLTDATGSKGAVSAATGLVTLVSSSRDRRYHHIELPVGPPTADPSSSVRATPPGPLTAESTVSGGVVLRWAAATDGTRWSPAADGVTASGYVVYRNGTQIGTTARTSYADMPPDDITYTYAVRAMDQSGLLSEPVTVLADTPQAGNFGRVVSIAALCVGLTGAALLQTRRRRVTAPRRGPRQPIS